MLKSSLFALSLAALLVVGGSSYFSIAASKPKNAEAQTETVEKLIVASGTLTISLDLNRLDDAAGSENPIGQRYFLPSHPVPFSPLRQTTINCAVRCPDRLRS